MRLNGKINQISGSSISIELDEELNKLRLRQLANGKRPSVQVDIEDGRHISPDQRKKIWALIGDYADYTGYDPLEMEAWLKAFYYADTGSEAFSMASCSMETASKFLNFVIDFGFQNDIPWKLKTLDAIPSAYPLMMQCLKHRRCVICGKRAEIDHEPPIGSGRNRDEVDNRNFKFFPLCHVHHMIRHQKGIEWFEDFYHIKPVKLDEETLIALGLNTRKQFDLFDFNAKGVG